MGSTVLICFLAFWPFSWPRFLPCTCCFIFRGRRSFQDHALNEHEQVGNGVVEREGHGHGEAEPDEHQAHDPGHPFHAALHLPGRSFHGDDVGEGHGEDTEDGENEQRVERELRLLGEVDAQEHHVEVLDGLELAGGEQLCGVGGKGNRSAPAGSGCCRSTCRNSGPWPRPPG